MSGDSRMVTGTVLWLQVFSSTDFLLDPPRVAAPSSGADTVFLEEHLIPEAGVVPKEKTDLAVTLGMTNVVHQPGKWPLDVTTLLPRCLLRNIFLSAGSATSHLHCPTIALLPPKTSPSPIPSHSPAPGSYSGITFKSIM